ncbi:MAG: hypothetical protein HQL71_14480 [Magnetococcales bacterium]|nr:hypothetical protein [Magnetococcales bacterium]
MKLEEGIGLLAVVFIFGIVGAALLPDDMWEDHSRTPGMSGALQGSVGINPAGFTSRMASPLQGVAVAAINPTNQNAIPQQVPRTTVPKPGLTPFSRAPIVRFSGTIQQITELQQRDGQIHIWLTDANGREKEISVAPSWYLEYMDCTMLHDMRLSGTGFQFDKSRGPSVIYAKKLKINNRPCHLRNDEGFALWSNRLR